MKKIALTQRLCKIESTNEQRDSLDTNWYNFIIQCGYIPVAVPNKLGEKACFDSSRLGFWLNTIAPDGFILTGGEDIGVYKDRDLTEQYIHDYAKRKKLPLLGICRGMQFIATQNGVGLKKVESHVNTHHLVTGNIHKQVNSYHNYNIDNCPDDYEIIASANDSIEAICHKNLPWEGWMWHPERNKFLDNEDIVRVRRLFK